MDEGPKDVDSMEPNWLKDIIGSKMTGNLGEKPKVVSSVSKLEISLPDSVVDSISYRVSLSLMGKFVSFQPNVDMTRKWCSSRWRLFVLVTVLAMVGSLFLFRFTTKAY